MALAPSLLISLHSLQRGLGALALGEHSATVALAFPSKCHFRELQ